MLKSLRNNDEVSIESDLESIHYHDVIIIGGGLTGLRAALQISNSGLSGAIISKVHPLRLHSVAAQGGMNASLGNVPGDDGSSHNWEMHAYDTVKGLDYLADQDAVEKMCREAVATVYELEHMGTVWSTDWRMRKLPSVHWRCRISENLLCCRSNRT